MKINELNENLDFSMKPNEKFENFYYFFAKILYLKTFIQNIAEKRPQPPRSPTGAPTRADTILSSFFLQIADLHAQLENPAHMTVQ